MVIDYSSRARKNIKKILLSDARVAGSLEKRLKELSHNPIPPYAKAMKGKYQGTYRIPFYGDYGRIIYRIDDDGLRILEVYAREGSY